MPSITSIVNKFLLPRQRELEKYLNEAERLQRSVLAQLLRSAMDTEYGKKHNFSSVNGYEDFIRHVLINSYEDLKDDINRMRHGGRDILWPGRTRWYAVSSGTTSDKQKFIPVSREGLRRIHCAGGFDTVAIYLRNNPHSHLLDGHGLVLGGSYKENLCLKESVAGDLSAIMIDKNVHPVADMVRVPKHSTALMADFEQKCERIVRETMHKRVTSLSGAPSWMLSVLTRMLDVTGKTHINEVWPDIEVFFHGGVAFTPYRDYYHRIITSPNMHYMETYNASEGFFGIQDDPADKSLLLLIDRDVFYEFIPVEGGEAVPLWAVETGKNYAIVITTSCGLWRYIIGDTVRFTAKNPYKFIITGRTKHFINAFGEELVIDNAEQALAYACQQTHAEVLEYTAAPVFIDEHTKGCHQWLIEFSRHPDYLHQFASHLDKRLQELNGDYEVRRHNDTTIQFPEIIVARPNLFKDWLKMHGKLGGQHKVPHLSNTRKTLEQLLELNKNHSI
ncbi:MAG: GH3 auxin-responsive promoter family protein [Bacteroidales bacterium]|nr:GH3 auxin-responsive promoter family protein [Bacteroidales bacterium]